MNPDALVPAGAPDAFERTAPSRHRPEEQYENLDQQRQAASLGMWVFLATEVMFFGVLFLSVGVYRFLYPQEFEVASEKLVWQIGGINTLVLLLSSLTIAMAVYYAQTGKRRHIAVFLVFTALLGLCFLGLKALEYYLDYRENLIPGWKFDASEWISRDHLRPDQVPHVKLFLFLYWFMTLLHGLHVTIGIVAVLVIAAMAWLGHFTAEYYSPVDVTALYWHFVDIVWIFLLPTLYLLGTHHLARVDEGGTDVRTPVNTASVYHRLRVAGHLDHPHRRPVVRAQHAFGSGHYRPVAGGGQSFAGGAGLHACPGQPCSDQGSDRHYLLLVRVCAASLDV